MLYDWYRSSTVAIAGIFSGATEAGAAPALVDELSTFFSPLPAAQSTIVAASRIAAASAVVLEIADSIRVPVHCAVATFRIQRTTMFETTASPRTGTKSSLRYPPDAQVVKVRVTAERYLPPAACAT